MRNRSPDLWTAWFCCSALLIAAVGGCTPGGDDGPAVSPPASDQGAPAEVAAARPPAVEPPRSTPDAPEGFVPIRLTDCRVFSSSQAPGAGTWSADDTTIRCSGQPRGYLYTKKPYRNFTLHCDFRFRPPDDLEPAKRELCNTGFLIYVTEPHKQWPRSLEVQGRHDQMAAIKANGGASEPELALHDEAARPEVRKPVGEWNSIEIVSRDGTLTARLNGTVICESGPTGLREGPIGLQSEGVAVEFRHLRIREEPSADDQRAEQ